MPNNISTHSSRNNIFSHSLMSFHDDTNHHNVINNILKDILNLYNADRSYIFIYDFEQKIQKYQYEACANNTSPQIDIINEVNLNDSNFLNAFIFNYQSFAVNDIEELKEDAISEYEILKAQDIKSLIITPIIHMDNILGYVGVDIVKEHREWCEQDANLLLLLSQIIGASLSLIKNKNIKQQEAQYNNIIRALESIYNDIPIGIELYNSKGCIIDINNTDMKIFGVKDKWKIMGISIFDNPALPEANKELLRKGEGFDLIFDYDFKKVTDYYDSRHKHSKYINCKAHVIKDNNGEILYYLLFNSDITSLRNIQHKLIVAKEKAEEADKLKMAFLANMSHEIRTPLNAIVGFSEILLHTDCEKEKKEFSNIISTNSELLLKLIDDILDLSKIEAGTLDYNEERFDINELFNKFDLSFRMRTSNKVSINCIKPIENIFIHFDHKRISQLLNNFLSNAIKYTVKGEIEFGYQVVEKGLKLYVRDTGIGISEENQKKIFNRFEKLDTFAQGTGLGLSICKAMLEAVKGEIGFESELGKGSYFWAWVPCEIECNP